MKCTLKLNRLFSVDSVFEASFECPLFRISKIASVLGPPRSELAAKTTNRKEK
jgi:hypothetical protein